MKNILITLILFLLVGCTIKINQILPGTNTTIDAVQTDEADVETDADIPVTGQGMATTNNKE